MPAIDRTQKTLRLSDAGKEQISRARKRKQKPWEAEIEHAKQQGQWLTLEEKWLQEAIKILNCNSDWQAIQRDKNSRYLSESSLKRFLRKERIQAENFRAFCGAVEVNWEDVADRDSAAIMGDLPIESEFYGRQSILATLQQWIADRQPLIVLYGRAGIGKTAAAYQLTKQVASQFDCVVWRSLESAPPLTELIRQLIFSITERESQGDSTQLIDALQQRRCLIVFDDWETMINSEIEAYRSLLRKVSRDRHKSCLLLLSQENPQDLDLIKAGVKTLELAGLNYAEDQAILRAEGLIGTDAELQRFLQIYSNPLILKCIAELVRAVHGGRVATLAETGVSVLETEDIERLIWLEFRQLPKLAQQVVYWLAIWHEPIAFPDLMRSIAAPVRPADLNKALYGLISKRSIVQVQSEGDSEYFLEPVTLKCITNQFVKQSSQQLAAAAQQQQIQGTELFNSHAFTTQTNEQLRSEQIRRIVKPIAERLLGSAPQLQPNLESLLAIAPAGYAQQNLAELLAVL